MPIYLFQNPETKEVKEIVQSINDKHEYFENGIKFQRIFTVPQAAFDTRIDPHDSKAFVEKTGKQKGKLGDIFDQSREASEKRKKNHGGKDPVKNKYWDDWSKKRKGKVHPNMIKDGYTPKLN